METEQNFEITIDKFKLRVPGGCWYTSNDTWLKVEGNSATLGVTDFLQTRLGDILFFTPEQSTEFKQEDIFGTIESIKATIDLNIPVSGKLIEHNQALQDHPELLSQDPYGKGWIMKIELTNFEHDKVVLLSPEKYFAVMQEKTKNSLTAE